MWASIQSSHVVVSHCGGFVAESSGVFVCMTCALWAAHHTCAGHPPTLCNEILVLMIFVGLLKHFCGNKRYLSCKGQLPIGHGRMGITD